jgi:hypothetical protein
MVDAFHAVKISEKINRVKRERYLMCSHFARAKNFVIRYLFSLSSDVVSPPLQWDAKPLYILEDIISKCMSALEVLATIS